MHLVDSKRRRATTVIAHLWVAGVSRSTADSAMVVKAGIMLLRAGRANLQSVIRASVGFDC